ncbi:hypothetical protein GCM10010399_66030 [Dactylosporangium fulvum]
MTRQWRKARTAHNVAESKWKRWRYAGNGFLATFGAQTACKYTSPCKKKVERWPGGWI